MIIKKAWYQTRTPTKYEASMIKKERDIHPKGMTWIHDTAQHSVKNDVLRRILCSKLSTCDMLQTFPYFPPVTMFSSMFKDTSVWRLGSNLVSMLQFVCHLQSNQFKVIDCSVDLLAGLHMNWNKGTSRCIQKHFRTKLHLVFPV